MLKLGLLCVLVVGTFAYPNRRLDKFADYAKKHPNTDTTPNPELGDLFEGDIELREDQPDSFNAMVNLQRRWPTKTIPYTIGNEYSDDQKDLIKEGIRDLVDSTKVGGDLCVNIVERTNENNYVFIQKASGCSSFIGMTGGSQRMSLVDSCVTRHGTIMHEFLHAYGFYHEQSRTDRDDYVYVNYDNIQPGTEGNFRKYDEDEIDLLDTLYDYGSVLHYGAYGFAVDPSIPTIIPHDPDAEIGQRTHMSELDIERVQIFYCCLDAKDSKYHQHLAGVRPYCDGLSPPDQ